MVFLKCVRLAACDVHGDGSGSDFECSGEDEGKKKRQCSRTVTGCIASRKRSMKGVVTFPHSDASTSRNLLL